MALVMDTWRRRAMASQNDRVDRQEIIPPSVEAAPICFTVLNPNELPAIECPARMPSSAKRVASLCWSWSPANDRLDTYDITSNSGRTQWILWLRFLKPNAYKPLYLPRGYCQRTGLSDKDAAMLLLFMVLRSKQDAGEDPGLWGQVTPGLLSAGELSVLATMLWGQPAGAKPK
jgi:hypothetical protein